MSSEWPIVSVSSICTIFDGPHATPKKTNKGPVFLGISNLNSGRLNFSSTEFLSEDDFVKWTKRVTPQEGDVVFSYETRLGQAAIVPAGLRCCLGRRMALMRINPTLAIPEYVLYAFLAPEFQDVIRQRTIHGSTVDRIPLIEFGNFPIRIPPLRVQREIVGILKAVDDRIALLRETNATLESIAQAIFKSWFVDFDPVGGRQDGRVPDGMDGATAALFPDSFETSALGLVPRGWRSATIEQVVEGVYDGPHATPPEANTGPIFLGIRNLTGTGLELGEVRHIHEDQWSQWTRRIEPRHGDIVFSYEATLGFFALIPPATRCCLGRRLALVRPCATNGYGHFWFHQFIAAPFQRLLAKHTIQGATVNRLALKYFPSYAVLNPPDDIKLAFEVLVKPIWAKIHDNQARCQSLVAIRDTLLPRLISGQLRLREDGDILKKAA
ncbi:restriction endonuclease subunit S [Massilia sp. S19_KUP03_FR1]|uniref:restriction endonuclease subunit S n=1 Tax=Massilia sp. S19_KUP03_FR1 TaxID=3025503 RepID=UPI002FCDB20E